MALKYYQFDYAEITGAEILNLGSLCIATEKGFTNEVLREYTRRHLKKPKAIIMLSNITKLTKDEFYQLYELKK